MCSWVHENSIYETAMTSLSLSKCSAIAVAVSRGGGIPLETFGSTGMAKQLLA